MPRASSRFALVVLALVASSLGIVSAAPPTPATCGDPDLGERIKCKFGNVLSQQEATADMLNQMSEIPDEQKAAIMKKKDRNTGVFGKSGAADFKQLAKKQNPECQVAEDPNGSSDHDGVCKGNEDCLEVVGDQIGDDAQPCKRTGKPSEREVCVQICDADAVNDDPDNFDDAGRGKDLEDELDDATEQYEVLNQMINEVIVLRAAPPLSLSATACDTVLADRSSNTLMWSSLIAKLAMETIADVSDKFCNQDVLGNNAATACAIIVLGKAAAVDTWEVLDNIDGNRDSDTIDTSFACLKELNASVDEGNQTIEAIESKVDLLQQRVDEVMELLLTPPGRRPGYPAKGK